MLYLRVAWNANYLEKNYNMWEIPFYFGEKSVC